MAYIVKTLGSSFRVENENDMFDCHRNKAGKPTNFRSRAVADKFAAKMNADAEVKVGSWIGFKSDVEQSAEVVKIDRVRRWDGKVGIVYTVKAPADGFSGHYIGRADFHQVDAEDIF